MCVLGHHIKEYMVGEIDSEELNSYVYGSYEKRKWGVKGKV